MTVSDLLRFLQKMSDCERNAQVAHKKLSNERIKNKNKFLKVILLRLTFTSVTFLLVTFARITFCIINFLKINFPTVNFQTVNFLLWLTYGRCGGSRLLMQWSQVRIRHISQWKNSDSLRIGRVTVYTVKSRGREGNLPLRPEKRRRKKTLS